MEQVHIGHYILGRTIGTGGFAKVKEARHDLTGVKVAVKIINKRKMKNKNMISKVKRQIKILKFINHTNIIKLYEVLDTTNDIFVIMELAEGGQLYNYIQTHDIQEEEAKFFFRQIVNGVGHAHANLISHRDLKPQNILIDNQKLIKIVDFGLSNLMKDGKLLKTACGSPNYAAPQIVGERKYEGTSVDIWSCGVILYALLVGSLPFDEETVTLLYKKIQQGKYAIPNDINPLAADLINKMLQVDPYKRIKIYQINNHPWLRTFLPLYCKVPIFFALERLQMFELDQTIFQQVKMMNFANIQVNDERLKKSIKKRDDESFVITYQLLKDNKYRKDTAIQNVKRLTSPTHQHNSILNEVENTLIVKDLIPQNQFLYGKRFRKPIRMLIEIVINCLNTLEISYSIKTKQPIELGKDYCLKCIYILNQYKALRMTRDSQISEQEKEQSQKEHKHSRKQIKFTLQIYAAEVRGYEHMIDLQLTQGHPLVFFNYARQLYSLIQSQTKC